MMNCVRVGVRCGVAAAAGLVVATSPAFAVVDLTTYAQFFQTDNTKYFRYSALADRSTITVTNAPVLLIGLAFMPAHPVGTLFPTVFNMTATTFDPVTATSIQFEQSGFSGTMSFTSGAINVLTISFVDSGVFNLTFGTAPTASLLSACPCGITWSSDVFELPNGVKDFALSLNAILGPTWDISEVSSGDFFGRNFTSNVSGTFAAVPEPGTWALMIAGFGIVGFAARRRRASAVRVAY